MIEVTLDLISEDKFDLATSIIKFFLFDTNKKFSDERSRLILLVNLAQAYKWAGKEEKCEEILKSQDWSAAADEFELAVAVLRDDFVRAGRLMKSVGQEFGKEGYRVWPLFRKFRSSKEFQASYKKVFGERFSENVVDIFAPAETESAPASETKAHQGAIRRSRGKKPRSLAH